MPQAEIAYFRVGEDIGYFPSESWTSSFLGHDDNFGPDFCVPRLYISPEQVDYVVELLKPGMAFGGNQAEALSLQFLYSVLPQIDISGNTNAWLKRLFLYTNAQQIVLRAVAVKRDEYIHHISNGRDWNQEAESPKIVSILNNRLPDNLWVVEVSVPELFPANERKLGDIVLNGETHLDGNNIDAAFLFVRIPGNYYLLYGDKQGKEKQFLTIPSNIESHFPLIRL